MNWVFRRIGICNPLTGRRIVADKHWTEVEEQAAGDIKGIWELSRFNLAFRLVRRLRVDRQRTRAGNFLATD